MSDTGQSRSRLRAPRSARPTAPTPRCSACWVTRRHSAVWAPNRRRTARRIRLDGLAGPSLQDAHGAVPGTPGLRHGFLIEGGLMKRLVGPTTLFALIAVTATMALSAPGHALRQYTIEQFM